MLFFVLSGQIGIFFAAAVTVFFVHKKYSPDRIFRLITNHSKQAYGFKRTHYAGAIIMRSYGQVPGNKVAANCDVFIRVLSAFELANNVKGWRVRQVHATLFKIKLNLW